jgi:hypothetical protein
LFEKVFFLDFYFSFFTFNFSFTSSPLLLRYESALTPFQDRGEISGKWELHRTYMGGRRELKILLLTYWLFRVKFCRL